MEEKRIAELTSYLEKNKGDQRFYRLLLRKPARDEYDDEQFYEMDLDIRESQIKILAKKCGDEI